MKKSAFAMLLLSAIIFCNSLFASPVTNVDQRLLEAFAAAYPSAEKITWTEKGGNFVVHFIDRNVRSMMEYDAGGRILQSIRYYTDPTLLPQNVSWEWCRRFPAQTLYGITEVSNNETTAWFLKGQDAKKWVTIKASADGRLQVVETLKKQP